MRKNNLNKQELQTQGLPDDLRRSIERGASMLSPHVALAAQLYEEARARGLEARICATDMGGRVKVVDYTGQDTLHPNKEVHTQFIYGGKSRRGGVPRIAGDFPLFRTAQGLEREVGNVN